MIDVKKVSLLEHNNGHMRGGCRDNGSSIVWQVLVNQMPHIGVKRKKDALLIAELITKNFPDWNGSPGCIERMARSVANQEQLIQLNDLVEV